MRDDLLDLLGWNSGTLDDLRSAGYAYLVQGHYETARTFFKALSLITGSLYDTRTLGALHLELGDYLAAIETLDSALIAHPRDPLTHLNRAKALARLGYRRQALAAAEPLRAHEERRIATQAQLLCDTI